MKVFKTVNMRKPLKGMRRFFSCDLHQSIFLLLFAGGVTAGTIMFLLKFGIVCDVSDFFCRYACVSLPSFGFAKTVTKLLIAFAYLISFIFAFGMFLPGQLLITLLSLVQGIAVGAFAAGLCAEYGFSGLGMFCLIFLPSFLVFINFEFVMMKRAFILSFSIFRTVFYGDSYDIYRKYKSFMIYFAVLIGVCVLCSFVIALSYRFFGKVFI
ncbi:MAG: hypothetical protein ACI4QV_01160 [Acutalibacteraceae bacterium]